MTPPRQVKVRWRYAGQRPVLLPQLLILLYEAVLVLEYLMHVAVMRISFIFVT